MMTNVLTAIAVMMSATLAHHMGLTEAVAGVARKIAKCHMCCSFWSTLVVLMFLGENVFVAAGLSVLVAYLSNYFALLLMLGQKIHDRLWQRLSEK